MKQRVTVPILALVAILLVAACSNGTSPTVTPRPMATPTPGPTPTPVAGFTTFTDESDAYTIQYPSRWQLQGSQIESVREFVEEAVLNLDSDLPGGNVQLVFLAIHPDGFSNGNITIEAVPTEMSVDEFSEASDVSLRESLAGYTLHGVKSVVVGDRPGVISDWEFDISSIVPGAPGKFRAFQLYIGDGKVFWIITCGSQVPVSDAAIETCDNVIMTFRILP